MSCTCLRSPSSARLCRQACVCVCVIRSGAHSLKLAREPAHRAFDTRARRLPEGHEQTPAARAVVAQRMLEHIGHGTSACECRAGAHGGRVLLTRLTQGAAAHTALQQRLQIPECVSSVGVLCPPLCAMANPGAQDLSLPCAQTHANHHKILSSSKTVLPCRSCAHEHHADLETTKTVLPCHLCLHDITPHIVNTVAHATPFAHPTPSHARHRRAPDTVAHPTPSRTQHRRARNTVSRPTPSRTSSQGTPSSTSLATAPRAAMCC